ncbi:DUF1190 domain-containing protein [Gynuella sunshinyii]|uniref:Putative integral membrane protein n=1 Tax=Gynuella sunshinyii YC6258 TaxID=1445510 RepID=A0A0C5VF88_9GAMM|nr:DUF1190 domain-containing protein [Gynuella sunshinyii]AJQ92073.1 putative integral membrane protein [Gynuella sunshinyii YC6258]
MKRTRAINLDRMRKSRSSHAVKPLALAIATTTLVACSSKEEAIVYRDVNQCIEQNPSNEAACQAAYQEALQKAQDSGPKYNTRSDCEVDFGANNCTPYNASGHSWFMPAMAGFMLANLLDRNNYRSAPLYTSYSYGSPAYGRWTTVDGNVYGSSRSYGSVRVDNDAFKSKPKVTRTISRGGFGSTVSAKSSWGGSSKSSSRSSWGG